MERKEILKSGENEPAEKNLDLKFEVWNPGAGIQESGGKLNVSLHQGAFR
jgi:hypothetical protein